MCEDCGCGDPDVVPIEVQTRILSENDRVAHHNRHHFEEAGVLAVNLMGSPGAGKTAVLEATARALGGRWRLSAVSGDLATTRDADRLNAAGIQSRSITTGTACHLDARLVHESLHHFDWREADLMFVENVGNLVCPASWDLGETAKIVLFSVTEGEDKPVKYPKMFRESRYAVLTKTDLLPYVPFDMEKAEAFARDVNPDIKFFRTSAQTGEGLEPWFDFLRKQVAQRGS